MLSGFANVGAAARARRPSRTMTSTPSMTRIGWFIRTDLLRGVATIAGDPGAIPRASAGQPANRGCWSFPSGAGPEYKADCHTHSEPRRPSDDDRMTVLDPEFPNAATASFMFRGQGVHALFLAILVPSLYTAWSVQRYFGFARAAGADHFRRRYREMPLVTRGAFAWTPNAMYTFGFLGLWAVALFGRSHAGLVAALFQHAYIWVHYACTEQPDMELLYGNPGTSRG